MEGGNPGLQELCSPWARLIGLLFALTMPLALLAYWLVRSAVEAKGQKTDFEPLIAFFGTLLLCPLVGVVIGFSVSTLRYPLKRRDIRDRFSCLECGEEYVMTAVASGELMRCSSCGRILATPAPDRCEC